MSCSFTTSSSSSGGEAGAAEEKNISFEFPGAAERANNDEFGPELTENEENNWSSAVEAGMSPMSIF